MGGVDAPAASAVKAALSAVGGSGTYVRAGEGGDLNPATGDIEGTGGDTDIEVAVGPGPAAVTLFEGTVIEQGDETAIVGRKELGFEPDPGADKLIWKGKKRRIVAVDPIGSGDQDAAYVLLLRV